MGKRRMLCPYCKGNLFKRVMTEIVEMYDNGDVISDEHKETLETTYACKICGKDVTGVELGFRS